MPDTLTENRHSPEGTYTEEWHTEPPPIGVKYIVLDQEWNDDYTIRRINRIRLEGTPE